MEIGKRDTAWFGERFGEFPECFGEFPELVTCKERFREVTTQIWSEEVFRGLPERPANVLRTIRRHFALAELSERHCALAEQRSHELLADVGVSIQVRGTLV